jgi:hypothetical protein
VLHEAQAGRGPQEHLVDTSGCHQQEIRLWREAKQLLPFPAGDHQETETIGHKLCGNGAQIVRDRFAVDDRERSLGPISGSGSRHCATLFDPLLAHALLHLQEPH